jgi:hypothetical protein
LWQFPKFDVLVYGKMVAVKVAVSQFMTSQQPQVSKQQQGCWRQQGSQQHQECMPALSKGHTQEKAQPQQQKSQQPQNLYGKAIKVAGNEARNMFQRKKNVDHQGPRPLLNNRHVVEPPCFSLYIHAPLKKFCVVRKMNETLSLQYCQAFARRKKIQKRTISCSYPLLPPQCIIAYISFLLLFGFSRAWCD